jgi:hypothetical protein
MSVEEVDLVKSQNATSPNGSFFEGQDGGRRKMPYAFTEQGLFQFSNKPCYPRSFIIRVESPKIA